MMNIRRFGPRFLEAALHSPAVALAGVGLTVLPLVAGAVVWLTGLASWAVFWLTAAAAPVMAFIVYHLASLAWIMLDDEVARLKEELEGLPVVDVSERVADTWAHLHVRNNGRKAGRFHATATIIGGTDQHEEQHSIRWREALEREMLINGGGDSQVLNVAEGLQGTFERGDVLRYRDFRFHTARLATGKEESSEWFERQQVSDDGIIMEVSITSDPPLREKFEQTYLLREAEEPSWQTLNIVEGHVVGSTPPNPKIEFQRIEPEESE